ncbi:MAG: NUDIX hydrolase N-terminal domain-containing protein [Anaerolineae bacterium]|nr:NUDIX hydrolase N-terminal domain-containing protein [Anaerolineae bacterium]
MHDLIPLRRRLGWWAHALLSMARRGQRFSPDPHDQANYARLWQLGLAMRAEADQAPVEVTEEVYREALGLVGPIPVADAAVFNSEGQILLIQRADDGLWAMPGGALDVGETAAEGACREAWEETGLRVRATALIGVYDSRFCGTRSSWHLYQFVFLCEPVEGELTPSHETPDVRWFDPDALPPLSPGHPRRVADAIAFYRRERPQVYFDQ